MKKILYIIGTSHVLLPAYLSLTKEIRCGLFIEEFAEFTLTLSHSDRDEIESQIFDTVYFRHRDVPEYQGLYGDGVAEWRDPYNLLSARISKLYDAMQSLAPQLKALIHQHVEPSLLENKRILYGVEQGDVMLLVKDDVHDD